MKTTAWHPLSRKGLGGVRCSRQTHGVEDLGVLEGGSPDTEALSTSGDPCGAGDEAQNACGPFLHSSVGI